MNLNELGLILEERFLGWTKKLIAEHATPVLLLGVGHDAAEGKIVVLVVDDPLIGQAEIAAMLRYALRQL